MKRALASLTSGMVLFLLSLAWFIKTLGGGGGEFPMVGMALGEYVSSRAGVDLRAAVLKI